MLGAWYRPGQFGRFVTCGLWPKKNYHISPTTATKEARTQLEHFLAAPVRVIVELVHPQTGRQEPNSSASGQFHELESNSKGMQPQRASTRSGPGVFRMNSMGPGVSNTYDERPGVPNSHYDRPDAKSSNVRYA